MLTETITDFFNEVYTSFNNQIPEIYQPILILGLYTIVIAIYAIFIWKFYKFLARKNILRLNLNRYNRTEHPVWNKITASAFFLLEYVIIVPILVFFWFSVLSIFLLLLSKNQDVNQILIISAAIVAAIRLTSYYSNDLSKDLAKMFPFTVLAIFLLEPGFFSVSKLIERFSEIPSLFQNFLIYLVFIIILEIVLRVIFTLIEIIFSSNQQTQPNVKTVVIEKEI